jgi:hypothetical protein
LLQHLSWVLGIEPRLPYLCRRNRARPVFEASANKPHRIGRPGETDGQLYSQQRTLAGKSSDDPCEHAIHIRSFLKESTQRLMPCGF